MDDPSIFRTHLQQIFSMLKYKSDKAALYRYAQENRTELRDMDSTAKLALLSMMGEQAPSEDDGGSRRRGGV